MSLKRVGGKSDGGIDLIGWWWLPLSTSTSTLTSTSTSTSSSTSRSRIRVLAQCKAEKKKLSPNYVREMEGVWHMHHSVSTVALILSQSPFTTATLTHTMASLVPFLLIHLPPVLPAESKLGEIGSIFWNPALAGAQGLLRGELDVRWELKGGSRNGRPGLWCGDEKVESWTPE